MKSWQSFKQVVMVMVMAGLLFLLLLRICNSLLISTTFAPDEWYQGPEVAHRLVFG